MFKKKSHYYNNLTLMYFDINLFLIKKNTTQRIIILSPIKQLLYTFILMMFPVISLNWNSVPMRK